MVDEAQRALEEAEALKKVSDFLLRIYLSYVKHLSSLSLRTFPNHECMTAIHDICQLALVC